MDMPVVVVTVGTVMVGLAVVEATVVVISLDVLDPLAHGPDRKW